MSSSAISPTPHAMPEDDDALHAAQRAYHRALARVVGGAESMTWDSNPVISALRAIRARGPRTE